jgi:hypothetical protein
MTCAPDELAIGTHQDGTLECASVDELVYAYFTQACAVYLGWQGGCSGTGCTPEKWGYTTGVGCNDPLMGQDDICVQETLGSTMEVLYGLNLDDDLQHDTLFIGMLCK